jgi:hypothetical protein
VWLSPGLPADRAELAAALPFDLVLADHSLTDPALRSDHEAEIHDLPVGSLCVVTVFETDLIARLASRPQGVRLLVVGPEGYLAPGASLGGPAFGERAPELVTTASSVGQLATAIQQLATSTPLQTAPLPATALDAVSRDEPVPAKVPSAKRGRLITAGAVLAGLAIGGIVIASTEGASSASANGGRGGFGGGNGPAGGFGGGGTFGNGNGGGAPGGTGTQGGGRTQGGTGGAGTIPPAQELLACLQKQGFTGTAGQLLQSRNDPKLQQAFLTCVQQLRGSGNTSSKITGRP